MSEEPSNRKETRAGLLLWLILGPLLVLVVLYAAFILLISHVYPLQFVWHIAAGWAFHLMTAVLPALVGNATSLGFPILCLGISIVLAHRILMWLATHRGVVWAFPQTLGLSALLLLGSAAAIAMSGVAHQLVWMQGTRMIQSTRDRTWVVQHSHMRNLQFGILEFSAEKNRFPDTLDELRGMYLHTDPDGETARHLQEWMLIEPGNGGPSERVWYRKPSGDQDPLPVLIGLCSRNAVLCGFVDGTIRPVPVDEFARMDFNQRTEGGRDGR